MKNKFIALAISIIFTAFMAPVGLHAESECKGSTESACKKNANCTWVSSYKHKDGKQVSAYCRNKPEKSGDMKKDKKDMKKDNKKSDKKNGKKKADKDTKVKKDNKKDESASKKKDNKKKDTKKKKKSDK